MKHSAAKAALVALGYKLIEARYHGPTCMDKYVRKGNGKDHTLYIFRADIAVDSVKVMEEVALIP